MEHNANKINSFAQTDLTIPCKTGSIAVSTVILEWKDYHGERVDISARDEEGKTVLSFAKLANNADIVAMIEQNLFLRAVENGDIEKVKTYLTAKESNLEVVYVLYRRSDTEILIGHYESNTEQMDIQSREDDEIEDPPPEIFERGIEVSKDPITHSIWLKAIAIAQHNDHDDMLNLLYNDDRFIHGSNEDGQTILHQVVSEILEDEHDTRMVKANESLLQYVEFLANVLAMQNGAIFEFICKLHLTHYSQTDHLLRFLIGNGIDLNGRNNKEETFLMIVYEYKRFDIVHILIKLASREFVLDIDAIDESGETVLMKAKQNQDLEIVAALLILKLIYAIEDKSDDNIKSVLDEFRNTSDIFVKSWTSNKDHDDICEEKKTRFKIWIDAICIAMDKDMKHSEEILKLLLDCDILLSQELEIGYSIQAVHFAIGQEPRLLEMLLKSGKLNVNALDKYGYTALHFASDEISTSMLIRHGADINRKDIEGMTPIMHMWGKGVLGSRTIFEEAGTLVDLNAVDFNGRTALMNAVIDVRPDAVELLLKAGASVNLSDHLGFTALHHALHGYFFEHVEFPRNSEELRKRKEIAILFKSEKHRHRFWRYDGKKWFHYEGKEKWKERRMKIVEMLLRRQDIDVNALSFENFSPLDIAEGRIPEIPSSIKKALKEKGAVLNVFRQTESQSTSDFHLDSICKLASKKRIYSRLTSEFRLDVRCKFTLQRLVYGTFTAHTEDVDFLKEGLLTLTKTFKEQLHSGKDQQGRTALHLLAISFSIMWPMSGKITDLNYYLPKENREYGVDFANTVVKQLISIGCSVNETDIYGRTPLHYANFFLWDSLISHGADASIKDKHGNSAIDKTSAPSSVTSYIGSAVICSKEEIYFLRLMNNKQMEINVDSRDSDNKVVAECLRKEVKTKNVPKLLWEKCEIASRHPLFEQIKKEVRDLMDAIANEIGRLDPRFAIRVELVGSSNEGTKLDEPDEFDFCLVLTKISELCEVSQSPELPTGFVRLKRKSTNVYEASDFDGLFREDAILNNEQLNRQFAVILWNALINIEGQRNSEWNLELPMLDILKKTEKVLGIKMCIPNNFTSINTISIDIVPCIHVDGWWPDEAISNVNDDTKQSGCNLVFDRPQNLYPWFQYSESCARISFSKAESNTIKQSCAKAKEAYMIGKTMIEKSESKSKYTLKNCLLYCIEALTPTSEKASKLGLSLEELESKFHEMDRHLWLKCLMKCHLEFVSQDFSPCYFLPNFSSPIGDKNRKGKVHLKNLSLDWIAGRPPDDNNPSHSSFPKLCKIAFALYRCASDDTSKSCCKLPAPDPLWERFDRKQLIESLYEIAYK